MRVCRYLRQRVRKIGEYSGKSFKGFSEKKILIKRLKFITQFNIGFLLLSTGCRKVLGKMPA